MAMDDESIEDQIKRTIDRLTRCLLGDTERKHGLSDVDGLPSSFQTLIPKLKTDLYELSAHGDHHQVCVQLKLDTRKIEAMAESLATRRTPEPAWAFLGFIKDTVFNAGNIKKYGSLEELSSIADMNTQISEPLFTPLIKESMPHSALFLVAFDTDETFTVEADRLATLRIPQSPKVDDIIELKTKLKVLAGITFTPKGRSPQNQDDASNSQGRTYDSEAAEIDAKYDARKARCEASSKSEEDKATELELLRVACNEDMLNLIDKYRHR